MQGSMHSKNSTHGASPGFGTPIDSTACYDITISMGAVRVLAKRSLGSSSTGSRGNSKNTQGTLDTSLCLVFATWTESFGIRKPWAILGREERV